MTGCQQSTRPHPLAKALRDGAEAGPLSAAEKRHFRVQWLHVAARDDLERSGHPQGDLPLKDPDADA